MTICIKTLFPILLLVRDLVFTHFRKDIDSWLFLCMEFTFHIEKTPKTSLLHRWILRKR